MNAVIRKAKITDYDGVCAVIEEGDRLHREYFPNLFQSSSDGVIRPPDYISSLLVDPNACFLVAEQAGEIVGSLIVYIRETAPLSILVPRRFGYIGELVVHHDHRRMGIGLAMMEYAEEWARSNGAESVELTVYSFNQGAVHFYEELGYKSITQKMAKQL